MFFLYFQNEFYNTKELHFEVISLTGKVFCDQLFTKQLILKTVLIKNAIITIGRTMNKLSKYEYFYKYSKHIDPRGYRSLSDIRAVENI